MTTTKKDLAFDIDALFEHMINNLDHDLENELEWIFTFVNPDTEALEQFAESIADELTSAEESLELGLIPLAIQHENSNTITERTDLIATVLGSLQPDEVKELHNLCIKLAKDSGTEYIGVTFADPFPEDLMDYIPLHEAIARLEYLTETGLPENEPLPFNFAVECDTPDNARTLAKTLIADLDDGSLQSVDVITDDEPGAVIDIEYAGRNDPQLLTNIYNRINQHATTANAELIGVTHIEQHEYDETVAVKHQILLPKPLTYLPASLPTINSYKHLPL